MGRMGSPGDAGTEAVDKASLKFLRGGGKPSQLTAAAGKIAAVSSKSVSPARLLQRAGWADFDPDPDPPRKSKQEWNLMNRSKPGSLETEPEINLMDLSRNLALGTLRCPRPSSSQSLPPQGSDSNIAVLQEKFRGAFVGRHRGGFCALGRNDDRAPPAT